MMQRKRQIFTINKNNCGFTLLELMVVIAIVGVLASIAINSFMITRSKVLDAAALADTQSLGKVVINVFLDKGDVDLTHNEGDAPQIGTLDTSGNARKSIFTLSNGLQAEITGNTNWGGSGLGMFVAEIWHPGDTKRYDLVIDEAAETVSFPTS
jgi:prepilin-type N-terminal cleavage/methylation domain-containing protein